MSIKQKQEAKTGPIKIIYLGNFELAGGELGFAILAQDHYEKGKALLPSDDRISVFGVKRGKAQPRVVGGFYEWEGIVDPTGKVTTIRREEPKFSGRVVDTEFITSWETHSKAAETAHRARKVEAKLRSESDLSATLAPIKRIYSKTDRIGQLAIEVVVLNELRKGTF
jgi:hypothetical protein